MLAAKQQEQLYPRYDFHWQGKGAQAYAPGIIAEQIWKEQPSAPLVFS